MPADSGKIKHRSIGIALGSGSARGWAHIGVLQALTDAGIEPDIICGASVGAMVVIAVNLNGDIIGRHLRKTVYTSDKGKKTSAERSLLEKLSSGLMKHAPSFKTRIQKSTEPSPGLFDVLASSINIMQDRITRSRMAGDPPSIILAPRLSHIGLLEFDRASEAIEEGRACVGRMLPALKDAVDAGLASY